LVHCKQLHGKAKENDLLPPNCWNFGDGCKAMGNVTEFQARGWRNISWPLEVLRYDVANTCQHAHPSMFDFNTTSASEVKLVAIITESQWIPKSNWWLDTKLIFKCTKSPHGSCATKRAVLEHHSSNGYHCQPAVVDFCVQRPLTLHWVALRARSAERKPRNSQISTPWSVTRHAVFFLPQWEQLQTGTENSNLSPTFHWNLIQSFDAIWDVSKLEVLRW